MRIDSDGDVGIGTASPTSRLTVTGSNSVATLTNSMGTLDGTFEAPTGWTFNLGWSRTGGAGTMVATHATGQTLTMSGASSATNTSTYYEISFVTTATTVGTGFTVSLGGTDSGIDGVTMASAGTHTFTIRPGAASGTILFTPGSGGTFAGTVDTVTIRAITSSTANMVVNSSGGTTAPIEVRTGASGSFNSFIGTNAGSINTSGTYNTALGSNSMQLNTSGGSNTAIGTSTLSSNTSGYNNTAIGASSLSSNTVGFYNVGLGSGTLNSNTIGSWNIAVGTSTMQMNTTGNSNTAVGHAALYSNQGELAT